MFFAFVEENEILLVSFFEDRISVLLLCLDRLVSFIQVINRLGNRGMTDMGSPKSRATKNLDQFDSQSLKKLRLVKIIKN